MRVEKNRWYFYWWGAGNGGNDYRWDRSSGRTDKGYMIAPVKLRKRPYVQPLIMARFDDLQRFVFENSPWLWRE